MTDGILFAEGRPTRYCESLPIGDSGILSSQRQILDGYRLVAFSSNAEFFTVESVLRGALGKFDGHRNVALSKIWLGKPGVVCETTKPVNRIY